ncbi:MAG TPA: sigma-54 dependent transcriptional regulator [Methylophilaceae bacterium]|nr:sigma-54 dependent transcriptional regulator [Methylophilaceae bacterium]
MVDKQKRILAVDDEPNMRRLLEISLRQAGYQALSAANGKEALEKLKEEQVDLVVSDLHMSGMNGLELLKQMRSDGELMPFIMVTAQGEISTAVEAMKLGAADYILRPFDLEVLEVAIAKALDVQRLQLENTYLKSSTQSETEGLIGNSEPMQALKKMIAQVAPEKATVLIAGETGTGKELVAKAIHAASPRKNSLFVAVNCAAIPAEMLESELFGYEKGAFTGAIKARTGKFELADKGTLFLDEITEMPINLQAKLLRALKEGVIEKLGSNKQIALDNRIVAATNRDAMQAVKEGKLREDLYYRLNVFQLNVPALRERQGDVRLLSNYFITRRGGQISEAALLQLESYDWPGNVRELENVLERAAILSGGEAIEPQHLPLDIVGEEPSLLETDAKLENNLSIPAHTQQLEKKLIIQAIEASKGNKAKAAKLLEISERSLWYKLDTYNLK